MPCGCCLRYEGYRLPGGYGMRWDPQSQQMIYMHRWTWEQANGPIPDGMVIMHLCDQPSCYRLEHLRLGTYAENTADAVAKGRMGVRLPPDGPCRSGHIGHWFIDARGSRSCRECGRDAVRRYRVRQSGRTS